MITNPVIADADMEHAIALRTTIPLFLLIGLGFLARRFGLLRSGDERVLNAYVYYFALPALFIVNLSETEFSRTNIQFTVAAVTPVVIATVIFLVLYFFIRFSRNLLYLLIQSTAFGSLAFFGIPFITFAFPGREAEYLTTLSIAAISPVSVALSIVVLEFYRIEHVTVWEAVRHVGKRLSANPLILSILVGTLFSIVGLRIPGPISTSLHMLGSTTSTVAVFMLGVFLFGRRYGSIADAFKLSLLRMIFLPVVALLTAWLFNVHGLERSVMVLMHSMPIAISMIVLSERYNFYRELIASLVLVSSLAAAVYLNIWLYILGH